MVASPHYLATGAGLNILRQGGSAVDAAIATNAVLAVVKPYVCGLGGDLFAQVYSSADGALAGLNGSGRAAVEATPERVRELSHSDTMPVRGPLTVTVPGCVEAWGRLHERYGRLPLERVLADAIWYAEEGFPVSARFAHAMTVIGPILHPDTPARETFLPDGNPPGEGQILKQPRLVRTLRAIATEGPEVCYRGWVAEELVRSLQQVGGLLSPGDLAEHRSDWVQPLSMDYRGATIYELPPNSQGVIALLMLSILSHLPSGPIARGGEEYVHLLSEAARLAYADRQQFITDVDRMTVDASRFLTEEYGRTRAALIDERASRATAPGSPGDTIYLSAADADGNLVSLIESNFMGIGSGVMAGETGVMLQNRGHAFSLDAGHVNVLAPRKRTMHTLMPGMAFRDGKPWLVFGTMGGSAQAQIHVELLTRLIDQHMDLDAAIGAPRFEAVIANGSPELQMETGFPQDVTDALTGRGNHVTPSGPLGHAHAIQVLDNGAYVGAADPRADSLALGY